MNNLHEHDLLIRQGASEGLTLGQIAKPLGASVEGIRKYLRKHEVPYHRVRGTRPGTDLGARHPNWNGGRKKRGLYIALLRKQHPMADKHGYVAEHRLVVEESLGRFLTPQEVVHHIDGNKVNNRIDNLQVFASNAAHMSFELKGRPRTEAQRNCPRQSRKGMKLPPEWTENIRKALTGRKLSPEACRNISEGKKTWWKSEAGILRKELLAEQRRNHLRSVPKEVSTQTE